MAAGAWIFASLFFILPLVLLVLALLAFDGNLLAVVLLLGWMSLGIFLGAAFLPEGKERPG